MAYSAPDGITFSYTELKDGSWLEKAMAAVRRDGLFLPVLELEPSGDARIAAAVANFLDSNGTYREGDRAVINARTTTLPMALEIGYQMRERNVEPVVVLSLLSSPAELVALLKGCPGYDGNFSRAKSRTSEQYNRVLDYVVGEGKGHWCVVYVPAAGALTNEQTSALELLLSLQEGGLSDLKTYRDDGRIKSQDIIGYPVKEHAERLGLSFDEWRDYFFAAMAVPKRTLIEEALKHPYMGMLVESSTTGRPIRILGKEGTDLVVNMKGRSVIMDVGTVGVNAVEGTYDPAKPPMNNVTNLPDGEYCGPPVEESFNGVVKSTMVGYTRAGGRIKNYEVTWRDGRIVSARAKEGNDALLEATGLAEHGYGGDELEAFRRRRTGAEIGFGGVNPVYRKLAARLRQRRARGEEAGCTGQPLFDEKIFDGHVACGANDAFGGKSVSRVGKMAVIHTDFVFGDIEAVEFAD